jgi:hypothetical protein
MRVSRAEIGVDRGRSMAVAVGLLLLLMLGLHPGAGRADAIEAGSTRLTLNRQLSNRMQEEGVRFAKLRQAKLNGRIATFPVDGYQIDFASGHGTVTHEGGLRLSAGGHSVSLRRVAYNTISEYLAAWVDGQPLRIAQLVGFASSRAGFGDAIGVSRLVLHPKAAKVLNGKLHRPGLFKAGRSLGSLTSQVQPEWVPVSSGALQFSLDPTTFAKLEAAGVKPLPFEANASSSPTVYTSPLTGGRIFPATGGFSAMAETGLRLERESPWTQLVWTNMGVDTETPLSGRGPILYSGTGGDFSRSAPLAALGFAGATIGFDPTARTVAVTNLKATLTAAAAGVINEVFAAGKEPLLAGGEPLGTFAVTAQGS